MKVIALILGSILLAACSSSNGPTTINNGGPKYHDSLVSIYGFNSNFADSSGSGDTGTSVGCDFVGDRFGNPSSAIEFNGTNLISIPNSPELNFAANTDFTFCFWLKCYGQTQAYVGQVISKMDTTAIGQGYRFDVTTFAGKAWLISDQGSEDIAFDSVLDGRWHFVTMVGSASTGVFSGWLDDKEVEQSPSSVTKGSSSNNFPLLLGRGFSGALDDIRIYRRAIATREIDSLYHQNGW